MKRLSELAPKTVEKDLFSYLIWLLFFWIFLKIVFVFILVIL